MQKQTKAIKVTKNISITRWSWKLWKRWYWQFTEQPRHFIYIKKKLESDKVPGE